MPESEQLADLLIRWEELRRQGGHPTAEQLCTECPQLASQLQDHIRAMQKMESLLGIAATANDRPSSISGNVRSRTGESNRPLPSIPDYEVLDVLGRGGMGVVYRARQLKLDRTVAVKMLDSTLTRQRQFERFLDEAHAVASLQHPNIVEIYDFGQVGDVPFFSMEFVAGGSLKDRLADGPLNTADAVRLTESIARAVHTVHLQGFAHRDLKPANILLTEDGVPKVTDFGLVKRFNHESGHTSDGEILGTLGYLAPEQLDHSRAPIGPQTDVYALGTLLYEMLTGKSPFASYPAMALRQVLHEEPPRPASIQPSVPRDVEAICLTCLEKNVADRYDTAEALADDLARFAERKPILARRTGTVRRTVKWMKRHPQTAVLLLLVATIAAIWPVSRAVSEHRQRSTLRVEAVRIAPLAQEILQRNCHSCHGADLADVREQLDVLDHDALLDSDRRIIVPGHPNESRLIQRIADGSMPPEKLETRLPRLTSKELDILSRWILGGAPSFPAVDAAKPTPPVVAHSSVAADVERLLQERCYECHRYDRAEGGIRILHHRLLLDLRKVIIPGRPDESELFRLITSTDDVSVMPPQPRERLSDAEIGLIRRWIEAGAPPFPKSVD